MIIDSEKKENYQNEFKSQEYNDSLSQIFSIQIPKTKVIVRKRPLNQKEIAAKEVDNITIIDENKIVLTELKIKLDLSKYIDKKEFIFDKAYDEKSSNDKIYKEDIRPMIYNAFYQKAKITCFAYGQTGSGKTYTLFGNNISGVNNKNAVFGLYALAGYDIFQIKNNEKKFKNFSIFVSFYEIYCDKLYDLLNNKNRLEAREDYKHDINIVGLSENRISSLEELMKIVNIGAKQRTVGKTGANAESSRSHGIIQIRIVDTENKQHAKISFIDLAGSERESDKVNVDKKTRIDGAAINQSLLALKECIRALEQDKLHLPFRGSKLTLVLRDSFIGNCKTLMISTISPGYKTSEHTLNTLRYAYRLKEIKNIGNGAQNFKNNNINNKNLSKNVNDFKNNPNQFISNLLNGNNNINLNNNKNNNPNTNKIISSDTKNQKEKEKDLFDNLNKKAKKRKKSYSSSNSSMKDVSRDNSNDNQFKRKKTVKFKENKERIINNIKPIDNIFKIKEKNESKEQFKNTNNNICTLTLMTSNNNSNNNNYNAFNKNNQMNITQQINLHNTNLQNIDNNSNNNNYSFNLLNDNSNYLNISNNSMFSFQSNNFNNLNLDELEKKNDKMIEDIVEQDKLVRKTQQIHINSMCDLIKIEINTFQQYKQEQMDISTYIDSTQNILNSQYNYYTEFNKQFEKLKYMINQQVKLSNLIEQMKQAENNKLNTSDNLLGNTLSLIEDQNMINLKDLQNIQSQINLGVGNGFP